ncbi:MAG: peroxiredoxin [Acidilobaceae archaeon]
MIFCDRPLILGEPLPKVKIETTQGTKTLPEDYRGKWLVIFSYPANFTGLSATELAALALSYEEFRRLNTEVLGISVDTIFSHLEWMKWFEEKLNIRIEFPLIADPTGIVSRALCLIHAQPVLKPVRASIIVDEEGIVRSVLYYPKYVGRSVRELLRILYALQINKSTDKLIPAEWPEGVLVGEKLLTHPAHRAKEMKERLKSSNCIEWWMCFEEIEHHIVDEAKRLTGYLFERKRWTS